MKDISLALMTGADIPIDSIQTTLHQPTIKEISAIGELEYFAALQTININRELILAQVANNPIMQLLGLNKLNEFQLFLVLLGQAEQAATNVGQKDNSKQSLLNVFALLFPGYVGNFLPRSLYFNNPTTQHSFVIDENNFSEIKKIIYQVGGLGNFSNNGSQYNPKGEKAAKIAAKLAAAQAKIAKSQGKKTAEGSVLARYVSILAIGIHADLTSCMDMTPYQVFDLVERYGLWVNWDIDLRSRLAGAKPNAQPEDWMKNIH